MLKKKLFTAGCFLLFVILVMAQPPLNNQWSHIKQLSVTNLSEAESQLNLLIKKMGADFTAVDSAKALFYNAFIQVNLGKIDTAVRLFEKGYQLSKSERLFPLASQCLCETGNIYYNWGEYSRALQFFLKAHKESLISNDLNGQAEALNYVGKYHHSLGDFDKSMDYFQKSLNLAIKINDSCLQTTLFANIGKYYESLGNYDQSLFWYMKALRLIEKIDNRIIKGTVYNHLGNLYQALGNYELSLQYHRQSLNEREKLGFIEGVSKSYKNMGEVYIDLKQPDTAMYFFREALVVAEKVNYQKGIIKAQLDMGTIYLQTQKFLLASLYGKKALKLSEKMGYDKGIIQANSIIGTSYFNLNNSKAAKYYFLKSFELAYKNGMKEEISWNAEYLSRIFEKHGITDSALYFLKIYYQAKLEIENETSSRHIAELELSYEMEQKEKANELLRKQNEINTLTIARKNGYITLISIILGFTTLLIIAFYFRYQTKQKANKQLALLNTEIVRQNRELTRLNEQLNRAIYEKDNFFSIIAHEVRNPLWWFRNLATTLSENYDKMPKDKLGKAIQSLDESAKNSFHLMDNLLQWSKTQLNRISFHPQDLNLTELIDENIRLWKTATNYKNIEIKKNAEGQLKLFADKDMINTLIRNLLSNAIKYTHPNGIIEIEAFQNDSTIEFSVKDSGIGIPKANLKKLFDPNHQLSTLGIMQEKGSGIGLKLCKDFVELNQGSIEVQSIEGKGTIFRCIFPVYEKQLTNLNS